MQVARVCTATAMATLACWAVGCGEVEEFDAGDVGDVKVVQGDLEQAIGRTGVCPVSNGRKVARGACSDRMVARRRVRSCRELRQ